MNPTGRTSFGLYESLRIVIPGFYFTAMLFFFALAFFPLQLSPERLGSWAPLLLLLVTVAAGLTMYAKETSKRRRAFQENQPSSFLQTLSRTTPDIPPLNDSDAQRVYFYLLNNHMPMAFHEKIFFFGTVYHIMIQVRRTTFWFALAAAALLIFRTSQGLGVAENPLPVVFTAGAALMYLLNVRYNKADRKMQENYQDQIFWLKMNPDTVRQVLHTELSARKVEP